jgi:hypothetical protein
VSRNRQVAPCSKDATRTLLYVLAPLSVVGPGRSEVGWT